MKYFLIAILKPGSVVEDRISALTEFHITTPLYFMDSFIFSNLINGTWYSDDDLLL